MTAKVGKCSICGLEKLLTFEHIPPNKAFNNTPIMRSHWQDLINSKSKKDFFNTKKSLQRRGAGGYTLCQRCNNDTGSWYGPSVVEWAHQCAINQARAESGECVVPFDIASLFVLKMIFAMFASACGPNFFEKNAWLRKFVLNRTSRAYDPEISVFLIILPPIQLF